jgi:Entner-Doudoroff aldolase
VTAARQVISGLAAARYIAVIRATTGEDAVRLAQQAAKTGFRAVELTMTTPGAVHALERIAADPSDLIIGMGTVTTADQASDAAAAGAQFLVSPGTEPGLVDAMRATGCATIAGFLTPSELMAASASGADAFKLFPAGANGVRYLEALRGPFPDLPIIPTGGIGLSTARDWLLTGAIAVGLGGSLVRMLDDHADTAAVSASVRAVMVLADVPAQNLGIIDAHEHLFARATPELVDADPDLLLDDPDRIRIDLEEFASAGGSTVVEMTTVDYGRDLRRLREISRQTGVHIIAATGFNKAVYCRRYCEHATAEELAATQITDVRERGCGVVKFATSLNRIEACERTAAIAASLTHAQTGVPVLTHTEAGTCAEAQLDLLEQLGVPLWRVAIGHMDRNPLLDLHLRVASRGAFLSYDQLPKAKYGTLQSAIELTVALWRRGLHTQIVLGGDLARRSYFAGWSGAPGLGFLLRNARDMFRRRLSESGADADSVLHQLLIENPRRLICGE